MKVSPGGIGHQPHEGEKRCLNSELWHACAGPLVSLPAVGSRVVYFPQGHSEQVAASTNKEIDSQIPNYPSLPPQLICQLHDVTMHADVETDEVYAQMTLQPSNPQEQKDPYLPAELGTPSKQPTNYFCKTLTASDTSTHGGFSVPRRAAEKVFPPLDFSQQPPAQELIARDLHDNEWKFRHIFRGQPKRHLLTTGWSVFVSAKRLVAGDSVLFIWNENNQLLLGIRHANRAQTVMPSSVLSSDSMHIGLLAAAAHAAATNSRFTIFYNPRASPSEFVIPLAKYVKAVYHTHVSVGMRFRMLFETEESSVRRYMGTITGISDLDPVRWQNSHWRSVKVGWDESTAGERQPRVSLWEIEPLTTFPMYPSPFPLRLKRPWPPGLPSLYGFPYPKTYFQKYQNLQKQIGGRWRKMEPEGRSLTCFEPQGRSVNIGRTSGEVTVISLEVNQATQPGGRDDDMGLNSPLMWLRDAGNPGFQSFNLQGMGANPWLQPRLDNSMLGLQPDVYQAMAAAALQEFRTVDSIKHGPAALLQFQQAQNITSRSAPLLTSQVLQQVQPQMQQSFIQHIQDNQAQPNFLQNHLQHCQSFTEQQQQKIQQQQQIHHHQQQQIQQQPQQQQQIQQQPQQQQQVQQEKHISDPQHNPVVTALSQLASPNSQSPTLPTIASFSGPQNFPDSNIISISTSSNSPLHSILRPFSPEDSSHLLSLPRTNSPISSGHWMSKRIAVESVVPSGAQCVIPQVERIGSIPPNNPQHSVMLPSFTGKENPAVQDSCIDPQNNLLFGVNIDPSSLLVQDNMHSLRGIGSQTDTTAIPYTAANFLGTSGTDFLFNQPLSSSGCLEESGFLQPPGDVDHENQQSGTFVKVYKSGSFGRSLDITRFNSYPELRRELGRLFGLEGQLEDPLRSGWQLVFVDRENDVLLIGDDPWQEFVNNVWCIKILSPQEVQYMGKEGVDPPNSAPIRRLSGSSCDDYASRPDSRNLSTRITSVGSLDF